MKLSAIIILMFYAALSALGGCSSAPSREAMESVETNYRPGGDKPPLPLLTADSPFSDFLTYALLNNPNVEAAFYDWEMSVEEAIVAGSLPDPQLIFSAEIASTVEKFLIGLMQELPGPGKLDLRAEAASAEARKKQFLFEEELIHTAYKVSRTYYENALLNEKIKLTGEIIGLIDAQEVSASTGIKTGTVRSNELAMVQSERAGLLVELANLKDSRNALLARWREVLGVPPGETLPPLPLTAPPKQHILPDENALLNMALSSNKELKALTEEIKQAEALVKLAYKENMPDFGAGLGTDARQTPWSLMPEINLTLPIWREKIGSQIAAARAGENKSRSMLSAAELDLVIMLAEKAFMWRELNRQAQLIETQLIPLAEAKISNAGIYYQTSGPGFIDWLNAGKELLELKIRIAEITANREIISADIFCMALSHEPEELQKIINSR